MRTTKTDQTARMRRLTLVGDIYQKVQSTLVISKSEGPAKILRDIRISTYQICRTEEKR